VSAGALALEGVTRRFGEHTAVDDVSLEIAAGELLALIGASGSGKTTTLRIVAGYEVPDSGRVVLDGRDITALPPQKRGFGMVFQHYALFPHMPVEDNAFLMLKTEQKKVAFLHASCTEWKNTFSFELYGRNGKLHVDGLGGSYGVERLAYYKMLPEMGPPETIVWEYPMADDSWEVETKEFLDDIRLRRKPAVGLSDALATLDIVDRIYRESGIDHRA